MKISLRKKVIILILSLLIFVTIASSIITTIELQNFYKSEIIKELDTRLQSVEYLLCSEFASGKQLIDYYGFLTGYADASDIRLTLIDSSGIVLFDSNVPQDSLPYLENHRSRPEIIEAAQRGKGVHKRVSATINIPLFYAAKRRTQSSSCVFPDIQFIRIAIPQVEVNRVLREVRWNIIAGGGIALLLIAVVSYWFAAKLTYPILQLSRAAESAKKGDLSAHFERMTNDEIGELADVLNEMLDKLRDDLIRMRKLEKMRSQFLGNVSHELRTPIFAVQGYLETMLNSSMCENETQKKFIKKAYNQSIRLNNLFSDLIDISRIESGEMKMTFHRFRVNQWLTKQVGDLQSTAQEHNIHLHFDNADDPTDPVVIGDQERLNQVIINLVANAIKYNCENASVRVGYRIEKVGVDVYVKDTGRGIEEEHIPRIFERFYRVDKERSREVGGTGLGLAIVKHIVEAHGSTVRVKSTVGEGSTFSFILKRVTTE